MAANATHKRDTIDYDFATSTTCHGLNNIVTSKRLPVKLIWTLVVLCLAGGLLNNLYKLFSDFLKWSPVTDVYIKVSMLFHACS